MDRNAILKNSWDIHVHAAPCLFPRWGDAWDLVEACQSAGMAGVVLKYHHGSSVEISAAVSRKLEGFRVYGGVTLNHFVGGLNPYAVDAALAVGAKFVWLPTLHSSQHAEACGCLGGFQFQQPSTRLSVTESIPVLDAHDHPTSQMKDILELLNGKDVVLASGHIAPHEVFGVQRYIAQNSLKIRFLLNHVFFKTPALSVSQLKELTNSWTWFENVQLSMLPYVNATSARQIADGILAVPEARWVLASDSGQKNNRPSPDALLEFAQALAKEGIGESQLHRMMKQEPDYLLHGE
jgi:hypothetical protein